MVIFGYRVSHRPFTRFDFFKPVFLLMVPFCLWMATVNSGYFADYRYGDSIIPSEAQLKSSGPYSMKWISTRNNSYILFTSVKTGEEYRVPENNFPLSVHITTKAMKLEGQPIVYLGLYLDNPVQQVWRVRVRGVDLMSYERALFCYHFEASPAYWLKVALINFFLFLCSWLTFTSTRPRPTERAVRSAIT